MLRELLGPRRCIIHLEIQWKDANKAVDAPIPVLGDIMSNITPQLEAVFCQHPRMEAGIPPRIFPQGLVHAKASCRRSSRSWTDRLSTRRKISWGLMSSANIKYELSITYDGKPLGP